MIEADDGDDPVHVISVYAGLVARSVTVTLFRVTDPFIDPLDNSATTDSPDLYAIFTGIYCIPLGVVHFECCYDVCCVRWRTSMEILAIIIGVAHVQIRVQKRGRDCPRYVVFAHSSARAVGDAIRPHVLG